MVGVQEQIGPGVLPAVVTNLPVPRNPGPVVAQPVDCQRSGQIGDFESFAVYPELFLPL